MSRYSLQSKDCWAQTKTKKINIILPPRKVHSSPPTFNSFLSIPFYPPIQHGQIIVYPRRTVLRQLNCDLMSKLLDRRKRHHLLQTKLRRNINITPVDHTGQMLERKHTKIQLVVLLTVRRENIALNIVLARQANDDTLPFGAVSKYTGIEIGVAQFSHRTQAVRVLAVNAILQFRCAL